MIGTNSDYCASVAARIEGHYASYWGPDRLALLPPRLAVPALPGFQVARVEPVKFDHTWICASVGAWFATRESSHNLEFVAAADDEPEGLGDNLALVAYYQTFGLEYRLDVGHTIPIGRSWLPGSPMDHVLISHPYPWGPKLQDIVLPDRHIRVLWVLPLYRLEAEFRHRFGLDALEGRFQQSQLDYWNPRRQPRVASTDLR